MKLILQRFSGSSQTTLGLLFIDAAFQAYTLEDAAHAVKVPGYTRIPAGTYKLDLQASGRIHEWLKKDFPQIHRGSLLLVGVPGFSGIMIHPGNAAEDTEGCPLVGESANWNGGSVSGRLEGSRSAYVRIYPPIAAAIQAGHSVMIDVRDPDQLIAPR